MCEAEAISQSSRVEKYFKVKDLFTLFHLNNAVEMLWRPIVETIEVPNRKSPNEWE